MNDIAVPMVGESPRRLLALLQGWTGQPRPEMSHLLLVSISVLPHSEASPEFWLDLNKILSQCRDRFEGKLYDLSESERAMLMKMNDQKEIAITSDLRVNLLRLIQRHFPDHFGLVDQSRLLRVVNLYKRLANAIALVERYKGDEDAAGDPGKESGADKKSVTAVKVQKKAEPEKLRSLHINDIKLLEDVSLELGANDFSRAFIRAQELAEIVPDKKPARVMRELYASMDLLRRHALKGVEMRGSGNLFNQLTILLDQIVLASFTQSNPDGGRCSLNLNVESVFTRGFEEFLNATDAATFANILFEFRQANIIQNFDEFSVASELIRSRGGRIAVDALFPEMIGLVNLNRLNVEMAKVFWRQNAETVLPKARDDIRALQDAGVRVALVRVDDQSAVDTGQELGVTLFQGFFVDRLLAGFAPGST